MSAEKTKIVGQTRPPRRCTDPPSVLPGLFRPAEMPLSPLFLGRRRSNVRGDHRSAFDVTALACPLRTQAVDNFCTRFEENRRQHPKT